MAIQTENTEKIIKFFFGEMAEDERFDFEKTFAANPDLLEEMQGFEADLIEKYVRGWMNPTEKSRFERNFLNSKKRREKVEFSRRLITELRQEIVLQNAEKTPEESIWSKFGRLFLTPKFAAAAAFSVLILVFGGWFLTRNSEFEKTETVKNQPAPNAAILNQNVNANTDITSLNVNKAIIENPQNSSVNAFVKSPTPAIEKTPEPQKTPIEETPKIAPNPILALFAGTLRDGGAINQLNLPKSSSGATFQLNLKTVDYKIFRADITDANGKVIFKSGDLTPRKSVINLFVPSKNLKKGDFRINLYGKNAAGENESAADFQFRVN